MSKIKCKNLKVKLEKQKLEEATSPHIKRWSKRGVNWDKWSVWLGDLHDTCYCDDQWILANDYYWLDINDQWPLTIDFSHLTFDFDFWLWHLIIWYFLRLLNFSFGLWISDSGHWNFRFRRWLWTFDDWNSTLNVWVLILTFEV